MLALLTVVCKITAPSAFVGIQKTIEPCMTQMHGYRLDWMLERKDGSADLQTQDGYWVGEKGFEKSQGAQGLRYRMRPSNQEYAEGKEVDGLLYQFGPFKFKLGETFGGTGNNAKLRALKKQVAEEGITDQSKIEENEYWIKRYGHKRWVAPYVDQSQGTAKTFFRGLAAWSGLDPKKEERGVTWFEADYGKPWLAKYIGTKEKGWVTDEQVKKEYESGKILKKLT